MHANYAQVKYRSGDHVLQGDTDNQAVNYVITVVLMY